MAETNHASLYYGTGLVSGNGVSVDAAADDSRLEPLNEKKVLLTMQRWDRPRCAVFTHFGTGKREDEKQSLFMPSEKKRLRKEWCERFRAFQACREHIEHVFVFIAEGYQALLAIQRRKAPFIALELDRELVELAKLAAEDAGCDPGFVVPIGFDSLVDLLSRLQSRARGFDQKLSFLLLGAGEHMRYDSPKMVDAILRIAGRRTNVPVFRIDEDVLPYDCQSFERLLTAYAALPNLDREAIFAFSGGYGGWRYRVRKEQQRALLNNYAVRTSHLARQAGGSWHVDPDECKPFLNSLTRLGAEQGFAQRDSGGNHPRAQVISGAGLCLSYGAIKKLPPFANLAFPITWIDDHLKRRMHEALGDLGPNFATARVGDALFRQDRHPEPPGLTDASMRAEGVAYYLSTLCRGCLFDALIGNENTPGPYVTEAIKVSLLGRWHPQIFQGEAAADAPRAPRPLTDLGMELLEEAEKRLEKVRAAWSQELSDEELRLDDGAPFTPRADFPARYLRPATLNGRTVTNPKESRAFEVLRDADRYLDLVRIWGTFVHLLEQLTEDSDWIFTS